MNAKLSLILGILVSLYLGILGRAFWIQVLGREKLIQYSQKQTFREKIIFSNRASIVDRANRPLAINKQGHDIFILPSLLKDRRKTLKKIEDIVPKLSYWNLSKALGKRTKFTWLARSIELDESQLSYLSDLHGVFTEPQTRRFYPNGALAGQVLGFVGIDNKGLGGLEYAYDKVLRGPPQRLQYIRDAKGRPLKFEGPRALGKQSDLVVSLDARIQSLAEKYLEEAVLRHKAHGGGLGVMDAKTGEIWAMAHYPFFDPNHTSKYSTELRRSSFVTDPFEPGSVFKAITIASALEHKVVRPETSYYCERGSLEVQGHKITEAETTERFEWLSVAEILAKSSNVGTTKIAFDLGKEDFFSSLKKFGIGQKTALHFPGESRGILPKIEQVGQLNLSNMSFGHSVATTPLQIMQVYAAFAQNGDMPNPTLLKRNSDDPILNQKIMSKETADSVLEMLKLAVSEGTGSKAQIPGLIIAGKTSTAQRPSSKGGYEGHIAGFVGIPLNVKRRFVVFVYIDRPTEDGYYGGQIAAPVFRQITSSILSNRKDLQSLLTQNREMNFQEVEKSQDQISLRQAKVLPAGGFPSFLGLDRNSAANLAKKLGVQAQFSGHGLVEKQWPAAGEEWSKGKTVHLTLGAPQYE